MNKKARAPISLVRLIVPVGLLVILLAVFWSKNFSQNAPTGPSSTESKTTTVHRLTQSDQQQAIGKIREYHNWIIARKGRNASMSWTQEAISLALPLLKERRRSMLTLMRHDPRKALELSLRFDEWEALPEELRAEVETPFSSVADLAYYPVCVPNGTIATPSTPSYIAEVEFPNSGKFQAYLYGKRIEQMSRKDAPLQGITLDGVAALREDVIHLLKDEEIVTALKMFPHDQYDRGVSFATGDDVGGSSVVALAGGKVVQFSDAAEVDQTNQRLSQLDTRPGLVATSAMIFLPSGSDNGSINWEQLEQFSAQQASVWTETKKKFYMIRVNFPDNTSPIVTQADALTTLNGIVSDAIRSNSYNKTYIEAGVSSIVYTLPQNTTYYLNNGAGLNADLLRDARNTFRNSKSGADAAINIGPVSNNSNGDGGGLGDYDIVGVSFASIGLYSGAGGVIYAGLAGGSNFWMQGNNDPDVYIHEFGHNYGLGHSSSWDTTDGSVAGAGVSTEYGDIFDVMGSGSYPEAHFHSQAKAKLNWLTTSQWADGTAQGSNTYRIYRIDDSQTTSSLLRGVRVTKAASPAEYYWLSYRPAFTENQFLQKGVYLSWQRPSQTRGWLLDTTPNSAAGKLDASVSIGRTYSDNSSNTHITPLAVGGSGADRWVDVRLNVGPFPTNQAPVAQAITGSSTVPARSLQQYSATATDADGDTLAWYWNAGDSSVKDNVNTLTQTWTVGGSYTLNLTASDMKGGTHTVSKSVTVSDPLTTWTNQASGNTGYLRSSIWGKGRFVSVEVFGTILTSWDGVTWTNQGDLPDFDKEPALAFGNNVFVAVGKINGSAASQVCYSYDARTWRTASFPAGIPQMKCVHFAQGKFIAAGDAGNVLTSTDGITWTHSTIPTAPEFRNLTYDGTAWVAIAFKAANNRPETVWTSANGVSWSQQSDLGVDVGSLLGRPGMLLATGWYAGVLYSLDHGLTWRNAAMPDSNRWSTSKIAVADDGTLLTGARAMDEAGTVQAFLVSTDGISWSRSSAGVGFAYDVRSLTFGFGCFLATSDGGVIRTSGSFYPNNTAPVASFTVAPSSMPARENRLFTAASSDADGDSLTYAWDFGIPGLITDGSSTVKSFDFGGTYTGTLRVSDGKGGLTTLTKTVTVSDPASTWTQRTSGTDKNLNAIAANSDMVVAVGGNSGVIRTSTDGVTWATRTVASSGNITFRGAVWDGSKFVIVGQDYNSTAPVGWQGVIYTSSDGITWTRRFGGGTERNNELQAVAAGVGGLVAVGNSGAILESTDGLSWNAVTVAGLTSTTLKGASFGDGTWIITGHNIAGSGTGKVLGSTDRVNWMDQTSGVGMDASWQDMRKIAYLNNRFVGSGWYSKVRVSTNAGLTFSTTRADFEDTPGLAYGDNIYFAAGVRLNAASADINLLSLDGSTWSSSSAPTTSDRYGAVFFKHTFITVGNAGTIWQSGDITPQGSSNLAPTFAGYSMATAYQRVATLSAAKLLSAASDPDGDAIFLTNVSAASAQGGFAELRNGNLYYVPPLSYSGADSLSVTITDARGASVQGSLSIAVRTNASQGSNVPVVTMLPSGSAQIAFFAIPGKTYLIQRSTDLSSWTNLTSVTAASNGAIQYTDPSPPQGSGFYRLAIP